MPDRICPFGHAVRRSWWSDMWCPTCQRHYAPGRMQDGQERVAGAEPPPDIETIRAHARHEHDDTPDPECRACRKFDPRMKLRIVATSRAGSNR